jgi:hypothetical protein
MTVGEDDGGNKERELGGQELAEGKPTRSAKWSLLTALAVMAIPFVPMIGWWVGPLRYGTRQSRSLIDHAWWWWDEASFGPWIAPMIVVVLPPVLVIVTMLALPIAARRARKVLAVATVVLAWLIVLVALAQVGEDITFTWLRMPFPLAVQATAVTIWAFTRPWKLTLDP